jgi:hypothetical protein
MLLEAERSTAGRGRPNFSEQPPFTIGGRHHVERLARLLVPERGNPLGDREQIAAVRHRELITGTGGKCTGGLRSSLLADTAAVATRYAENSDECRSQEEEACRFRCRDDLRLREVRNKGHLTGQWHEGHGPQVRWI